MINVAAKKGNTDLEFMMRAHTSTMDEKMKVWYIVLHDLILNQMTAPMATMTATATTTITATTTTNATTTTTMAASHTEGTPTASPTTLTTDSPGAPMMSPYTPVEDPHPAELAV